MLARPFLGAPSSAPCTLVNSEGEFSIGGGFERSQANWPRLAIRSCRIHFIFSGSSAVSLHRRSHELEQRIDGIGSWPSGRSREHGRAAWRVVAERRVPSYKGFMLDCALALLVAAVLALGGPAPAFAQVGALRVGLPSLPSEVDPATALDGSVPFIARQVFDTLVQYRESSGDVEPALATQWSVSRDGLVWSFRLRAGVSFHDGTALTPQHVVDSLQREIRPQVPGGDGVVSPLLRGAPGVVRDVRARGPRTVEIVLSQPYAPLLSVLAHPVFSIVLPAQAGEGGNRWQGTGPFGIAEMTAGRIVLEASRGYWGRQPRLARLILVETDDAQADAALAAQGLDVFFPAGVPLRPAGALSIPGWRVGYLALQTEKEPFTRRKVRQAVAEALSPAQLAPALGQAAVPLQTFLPPGVWARREGPPVMGADLERARQLIGEAGLGAGSSASLLVADAGDGLDRPMLADAIRASLQALGLTVTVRTEPPEMAQDLMRAGEHQMALAETRIEAGDPHFLLYPLSASETAVKGGAIFNFSFYRNRRLDDLLIRASQLSFRPEREKLYLRAQTLLADELPWIPIYVRLLWAVTRPEVKGLRLHPSGNPRLDRVFIESPAPAPGPS
jgi:peptide/nickel transport system substrate-binding protein